MTRSIRKRRILYCLFAAALVLCFVGSCIRYVPGDPAEIAMREEAIRTLGAKTTKLMDLFQIHYFEGLRQFYYGDVAKTIDIESKVQSVFHIAPEDLNILVARVNVEALKVHGNFERVDVPVKITYKEPGSGNYKKMTLYIRWQRIGQEWYLIN